MASVLSPPGISRLWEQVRFVNETATWSKRAGEWIGFFKEGLIMKVQNVACCLNRETHLQKVATLKQYPPAYGRSSPDTPRIESPLQ